MNSVWDGGGVQWHRHAAPNAPGHILLRLTIPFPPFPSPTRRTSSRWRSPRTAGRRARCRGRRPWARRSSPWYRQRCPLGEGAGSTKEAWSGEGAGGCTYLLGKHCQHPQGRRAGASPARSRGHPATPPLHGVQGSTLHPAQASLQSCRHPPWLRSRGTTSPLSQPDSPLGVEMRVRDPTISGPAKRPALMAM